MMPSIGKDRFEKFQEVAGAQEKKLREKTCREKTHMKGKCKRGKCRKEHNLALSDSGPGVEDDGVRPWEAEVEFIFLADFLPTGWGGAEYIERDEGVGEEPYEINEVDNQAEG